MRVPTAAWLLPPTLVVLLGLLAPVAGAQTKPGSRPGKKGGTTRTQPKVEEKPAPEVVDLGDFHLRPPRRWKSRPGTAMRRAYLVMPAPEKAQDPTPGEFIIFFFGPRQGGSAEANLQRWKGMFARPAEMKEEDFARRKDLVLDGMKVTVLELQGTYLGASFARQAKPKQDHRMIAAVVETKGGNYYIRTLGPRATIDHWRKPIFEMIGNMKAGPAKPTSQPKKGARPGS